LLALSSDKRPEVTSKRPALQLARFLLGCSSIAVAFYLTLRDC